MHDYSEYFLLEKAALPVSSLVLQPDLHCHPDQERKRGFEFHCAINQPLESGTDNEAGAASKDAVRGSEFQLAPMGDLSNWIFSRMQMSSTRPTEK